MGCSWSYFIRFTYRPAGSVASTTKSDVFELPYPVVDQLSFRLVNASIRQVMGFLPNVEIEILNLQFLSKQALAPKKPKKSAYKRPQNLL